jgi:hypothetical protein
LPDVIHFQIRTTPVSDLEATFAAADFYAKPRSEIFELETQLKTARDKVAHLYAVAGTQGPAERHVFLDAPLEDLGCQRK